MPSEPPSINSTPRVTRHRLRAAARGTTRVEVAVPLADAPLVRSLAKALREDRETTSDLRRFLKAEIVLPPAATGADLVDFLLASPFREVELEIERDRSSGRPVDFE